MAAESSSRGKRTKRAGTPGPSTTSSTTARAADAAASEPGPEIELSSEGDGASETWTEPVPLTLVQQKEFVRLLASGASPAVVSTQMGVPVDCARLTFDIDERFRRHVLRVSRTLDENVRSAMYVKALKGTVSAQALWLKDAGQQPAEADELPIPEAEFVAEIRRLSRRLDLDPPGAATP